MRLWTKCPVNYVAFYEIAFDPTARVLIKKAAERYRTQIVSYNTWNVCSSHAICVIEDRLKLVLASYNSCTLIFFPLASFLSFSLFLSLSPFFSSYSLLSKLV